MKKNKFMKSLLCSVIFIGLVACDDKPETEYPEYEYPENVSNETLTDTGTLPGENQRADGGRLETNEAFERVKAKLEQMEARLKNKGNAVQGFSKRRLDELQRRAQEVRDRLEEISKKDELTLVDEYQAIRQDLNAMENEIDKAL